MSVGSGEILVPGLVDLQINGAYGHDFSSDPRSMWRVGARLPEQGVTAFLPTIITSRPEMITQALEALHDRPPGYVGAEPLGLHLEGPFLSPRRPGVHDPALMRSPSLELIKDWMPGVAMMTLAPELPGAEATVKTLLQAGVVVSAGHSAASYEEALAGFAWGIGAITHLFNAMEPFSHREPGLVGATFDSKAVAGIICDGVHVHPATVRAAWRLLGPSRLALVTDAIAATGLSDGAYRLGDREVQVQNGEATDSVGHLAGSTLTLDQATRNLLAFTGCTPAEAVAAASSVPASLMRLGSRSDWVRFDEDLRPLATIVADRVVWER